VVINIITSVSVKDNTSVDTQCSGYITIGTLPLMQLILVRVSAVQK